MTSDDEAASRELVERVGPLWSERRTSEALGKTPTELEELAAEGRLLRVEDSEGTGYFPLGQFTASPGGITVRPGVRAMLERLVGQDPWTVALILSTPAPELGGRSPVAAAADGQPTADLIEFAETVRAEWAAGGPGVCHQPG